MLYLVVVTTTLTTPEFHSFSASEYADMPDEAITWLIQDLLPASGSAMIYGPPKSRKPLALDTPILTTTGWKTMGTLTIGDWVFGPHGKPARVLAKSDVMADKPCYRITFSDKTSIVCDEEHPWDVLNMRDLTRETTLTERRLTKELAAKFMTAEKRRPRHLWAIELAKPLIFAPQTEALPLDPYVLGAWLGDGTRTTPTLTTADQGIRRLFYKRGYPLRKIPSTKYGYQISHAKDWHIKGRRYGYVRDMLRQMNLMDNKHIPDRYLYGSVEERMDLLAGLIDTDGSVRKGTGARSETAYFYNKNKRLIDQVAQLARSLGGKCSISTKRAMLYGKDCGEAHAVSMRMPFNPFYLGRKRDKACCCKERYVTITNIEPVTSVPVQCITVDDPQHLFLAGEGLTPTCNTMAAQQMAYAIADPSVHDWLSFPVLAHGPVLYLQLDTARVIWKERIKLYRDVNKASKVATDNLHIADKQSLPFPFEIRDPKHQDGLRALCATIKPLVVFVDVLRKATMAEESTSEGMINALNELEKAVQPAALVIISHSKKPQGKQNAVDNSEGDATLGHDNRGSSSIPGNVDGIIKITKKTFSFLSRTIEQGRLKLNWNPDTFLFSVDNKEFDAHLGVIMADPTLPSDSARALALSEKSGRPLEACRSAVRRKKGTLR